MLRLGVLGSTRDVPASGKSVRWWWSGHCYFVGRIGARDLGSGVVRARLGQAMGFDRGLLGGGRRQSWVRVPPVHRDWVGMQVSMLPTVEAWTQTRWLMPGEE